MKLTSFIFGLLLILMSSCHNDNEIKILNQAVEITNSQLSIGTSKGDYLLRGIEKETLDQGNKKIHLAILDTATLFSISIQKAIEYLHVYDSIWLLGKSSSEKVFDINDQHLNYLVNKSLTWLRGSKPPSPLQFFIYDEKNGQYTLKIKKEKVSTSKSKLILNCMELELLNIKCTGLQHLKKQIKSTIPNFLDYNVHIQFDNQIIEEGDTLSGRIFIYRYSKIPLRMFINNKPIPVVNGIGKVSWIAKGDKFDKNGLSRRSWQGEVILKIHERDSAFKVKGEYIVKKKCL